MNTVFENQVAVEEEVILTDASDEDDAVESEINQNMKKLLSELENTENIKNE